MKAGNIQKQTIAIRGDWTKAKNSNNEKVSVVETEIQAEGGFGFATSESMDAWNATKNDAYLCSMSRLVVMKEKKTGEINSFIMTVVADKPYFESKKFELNNNTYLKRDKDLSGYVLYHSLSGEFTNGWIYCDGQIINSIKEPNNLDLPIKLKSAASMVYIYQYWTVCGGWYSIGSMDGVITSITFQETGCWQIKVCVGSYEVADNLPDIGGGGGTPGGYTPPPACNCTGVCPICHLCPRIDLKSASLPGDGETTTNDPCEYCSCPPQNPIPSISSLSPSFGVVAKMTAKDVYYLIGGNVLLNFQSNETAFSNACALRLSYSLNSISGSEIPFIEGQTLSGDVNRDGIKEWYFYRVSDMVNYLNNTFGLSTLTDTNHISGMTGIIWQSDCGWDDASGHIDVWNGNNALGHYYDRCSVVHIWRN